MKQAAIGFRAHSGWAAVVAVCLDRGLPVVLARQRVHLVETFTYEFRQPYHTAEKMPQGQAREFISRMRTESRRLAYRAVQELESRTQEQGVKLTRCGLLLASGRLLPVLDKILASHALIHTADGELFREAILHASARRGLRDFRIREKELLDRAENVLRLKSAALMRRVTELGRSFGAPWSQDEKFAALAAWLALATPSKSIFKELKKFSPA
ncbi:MAG TPA: hypothetical protein VEW05_18310 [Candidatus Polarisedimenticolia bacterium]|nr:hypothetical protein [Candidatus Polarisedimenticolia bacterium]